MEIKYNVGELYNNINMLISKNKFNNKKVVIFGANGPAIMICGYLRIKGLEVNFIIDNDKAKEGSLLEGVVIKNPDVLNELSSRDVIILCASKYAENMENQVSRLGYIKEENFFDIIDLERYIKKIESNKEYKSMLSLKDVQQVSFKMLQYIKKICEEYGLKYYLCGGTLLGAVRHNGFIPWDDDIDITMPINDYNKMLTLLSQGGEYTLLTPKIEGYRWIHAKLIDNKTVADTLGYPYSTKLGIHIDIFPLYGLPNDDYDRREHIKRISNLQKSMIDQFYRDCNFVDSKFCNIRKKLMKEYERYNFNESRYVMRLAVPSEYFTEEIIESKFYAKSIEMRFENDYFCVPIDYDKILRNLYGDYNKLPPLEKRRIHHMTAVYWKE